jgi:2-dehydro-3-deoxyphosphooctonate aldolase (KDO 8-P synthase)
MKITEVCSEVCVGQGEPLLVIAGPCVIESREMVFAVAEYLGELSEKLSFPLIFKASFDKANRSSRDSYRGPGIERGLEILAEVKSRMGLTLLSDVHEVWQVVEASKVLDVIQIPAFLCRQTDLLVAAGDTGKGVNIKKGQFMSPWEMGNVVDKVNHRGNKKVCITERGTTFGYNNLVVDMRSIPIMREFAPVVFDATHSVQLPGAMGKSSGGMRDLAFPLAKSAISAGADGIFIEVHPDPDHAFCDGPNSLSLGEVEQFIAPLVSLKKFIGER